MDVMRYRFVSGLAVVLGLSVALVGCDGSPEQPLSDSAEDSVVALRDAGFEEQADMLADGTVTAAEVEAAGELLRNCFVEQGHQLTVEGWNPVDNVTYLYLAEPAGGETTDDFMAVYDDCTRRYIMAVSDHYRANTDPWMQQDLLEATTECLGIIGFDYSSDPVNQYDLVSEEFLEDGVSPSRGQVDQCVLSAAGDLYPDIVTISIVW